MVHSAELDPALADRLSGDDAAAVGAQPHRLALDAGAQRLGLAGDAEAVALGQHRHRLAGREPLARLQVRLAQALPGLERARQACGPTASSERRDHRRAVVGKVDLGQSSGRQSVSTLPAVPPR